MTATVMIMRIAVVMMRVPMRMRQACSAAHEHILIKQLVYHWEKRNKNMKS